MRGFAPARTRNRRRADRACPAVKFSTTTSAWRTRSANTSREPGCFRFSVTAYLPRKRFNAATETSSGAERPSETPFRPMKGAFSRQ